MIFASDAPSDLKFITVLPDYTQNNSTVLERAYRELRDYLESNRLHVFHERVYGLIEVLELVKTARQSTFEDSAVHLPPLTYVEGTPVGEESVAGIHIIAVPAYDQDSLQSVYKAETELGKVFRGQEGQFMMLSDIERALPVQSRTNRFTETTEAITVADKVLKEWDWSFKDVFRTWFYLDDILDWYDEFNSARNKMYRNIGFMNGSMNSVIPASTGIYGRNAAGYACTLDLLAIRPLGDQPLQVTRMVNPKQNEATEYGSAFSRGITISMDNTTYFFLSGTASIDEKGHTIHPGNMRKQTQRTLTNVKSLLENAGGDVQNIQQATAFVKNREDIPIFEEELHRNGLTDIPLITTIADVCRDDLLVELDATAVASHQPQE